MKLSFLKVVVIASATFAVHALVFAESARFGWEAISNVPRFATEARMTGPTAFNKHPEKRGVFKGEFMSQWRCQLAAIHKISLDEKGNLQSKTVEFTVPPVQTPETVKRGGAVFTKVLFETESLSFEPGEAFVLVFKTKLQGSGKEETEMIMLPITHLFIPS
jgi:hypothetical protein